MLAKLWPSIRIGFNVLLGLLVLEAVAQETVVSGNQDSKIEGPKQFTYVLKDEPDDIRTAIQEARKMRAEDQECYYFFYKKTASGGGEERFRRTQECNDFEYHFEE